jgi:hypothetical protein
VSSNLERGTGVVQIPGFFRYVGNTGSSNSTRGKVVREAMRAHQES